MKKKDVKVSNEVARRARILFLVLIPIAVLFFLLFSIGTGISNEKGSDFLFESFLYFILGVDIGLWFAVFIVFIAMQTGLKKREPEKETGSRTFHIPKRMRRW